MTEPHVPVMLEEFLEHFSKLKIKTFYDGTLGAAGHAKALLESHPEIETYYGCDQDANALEIAKAKLEPWKDKVVYLHDNFVHLDKHLEDVESVDGFFLTWGCRQCS